MESNRRFRRPRIVTRAVRKLRARAASTNYGRTRAASELKSPQAHLSLVTEPYLGEEPAAAVPAEPPVADAPPPPRRSRVKWVLFLILMAVLSVLAALAYYEMRTSAFQAHFFSKLAARLTYKVEPGPSPSVRFPHDSPYDERLGYANMPDYLAKLKSRDYEVAAQARLSPKMVELHDMGLFATYREKTKVGLEILDVKGKPLFSSKFPERYYETFNDAPTLLVQSLLFIENRELLDPKNPKRNPAVEWDRFSKAVLDKALNMFSGDDKRSAGGSTLATQIEKYRHSPDGRTSSLSEKLVQMASATLRAYQGGEDTTRARRQIVTDYLNTVPLSAKVGYGEVNGIGDGMWVWYGRDFATANRILKGKISTPEQALVYKEALSLMIAQRRPAHYLGAGDDDLEELSNVHLRVLAQAGVITPQLRDAALKVRLRPAIGSGVAAPAANAFVSRKASNAVRTHLAGLLGDSRLYNLDRLDLTVISTLDSDAQQAVTAMLRKLRDAEEAKAAGLTGKGMLGNGDPANVVYSFTLMERGEGTNYLRVQTDNYDQPLDINEGAKLDLGSTAKLRTLVTYMDIVDQLHQRFGKMDPAELRKVVVDPKDRLSLWAIEYLLALPANDPRGLPAMLEAAMERKYSGSPGEAFFTGGGLHTFGNFSKLDDKKILSVREALRASTNLVFVRLMRDVVRYYMFQLPGSSAALLADADDPRRSEYLARFADREGREFLTRFYNKYRGKNAADAEKALLASFRPTPIRLAAVHRTIAPNATVEQFGAFINDHLESKNEVPDERIGRMHEQYSAAAMSLADRGYLATIHPLELWLVGYMRTHEGAKFADIAEASTKERQEVYAWLFNTHRKHAQDRRIAGLLEVEAFLKIHAQWKKMGYPFDSLTPSYATTLGASADRPAALAEMMGIIVNGGVRKTVERIDSLHFAKATPYETLVRHAREEPGERVLAPEVARVVADAIRGVVSDGTAKRVKTAFAMSDGQVIAVGGKTGTGDQRFEVYGAGGRLIESRFVNRSATFVFNIGERFFGSMTAYVHGPEAGDYDFTSALPVQLLATLSPALMPMIEPGAEAAEKRAAKAAELKAAKARAEPAAVEQPADNAAGKPADKPAAASADKPAAASADKPAKAADKPAAKPRPAPAKPAAAPAEMPGAQNVKPSPVKPAAAPAR